MIARLAAATLFWAVLVAPSHPDAVASRAYLFFPLELPAVLLVLAAWGKGVSGGLLRATVTAGLLLALLLKAADFAMFSALSRGFNPVADLSLIEAGLRLVAGTNGLFLTGVAVAGAALAVIGVTFGLWWATGQWLAAARGSSGLRVGAGAAAVVATGLMVADVADRIGAWELPFAPPGTAFTAGFAVERYGLARATLSELRIFERAAANDDFAATDTPLDRIDRDVIVIFVESYGRTSLDTPLFADLHPETLAQGEARLRALGLGLASGILSSPTRGGQSWLAHATFANGIWVDGQTKYRAALASERLTLFHHAQRAGFHTAAVMPQIKLAWPESAVMGFETILAADDLGYAGLNFNWVTMPDQFTYAAMDRLLRETRPDARHRFIQVATGTSHAPWVPVPDLVDWDAIGDGQIFNAMAERGDPPEVVWRDRDRIRAQYRLAIDYALRTILDYAARHAADPPLILVIGDHQAAGFVALDERPDVPLHVIGPAHLVELAAADWALAPGLIPPADTVAVPMDQMRNRILETYSSLPAGPQD
jgi:hypothetical protein